MVDYSDIQTELDTEWNTGVIAKPTFKNGSLSQSSIYPNVLFISILPSTLAPIGPSGAADMVETDFFIKIIASTRADLEKFIREIKRIINTKSISGGHWRIERMNKPTVLPKIYNQVLNGVEKLFVTNSSWS